MDLPKQVIGGGVSYLPQVRKKKSLFSKNVLFFGIRHMTSKEYEKSMKQGAKNYIPSWLGALAAQSATISRTAILLEFPPFKPDELLPKLDLDGQGKGDVTSDEVLRHTLIKIRPFFKPEGDAFKNGWSLLGIDLRYKWAYEKKGFKVVFENKKNNPGRLGHRYSIQKIDYKYNKEMTAELTWHMTVQSLYNYYLYLIGHSDNKSAFNTFVNVFCHAAGHVDSPIAKKKAIFDQAAAFCRSIYAGVPMDIGKKIIHHLINQAKELDGWPNPTMYEGVREAVALQLPNLALLGCIFAENFPVDNIVVVIGENHVTTVEEFISTPSLNGGLVEHGKKVSSGKLSPAAFGQPIRSTFQGTISIT